MDSNELSPERGSTASEAKLIHNKVMEYPGLTLRSTDFIKRALEASRVRTSVDAGVTEPALDAGITEQALAEALQDDAQSSVGGLVSTDLVSSQEAGPEEAATNPIKACWITDLGDPSEIPAAAKLADDLVEFARGRGIAGLENPTVAASVATAALHTAKAAHKVATGKLEASTALAHIETVVAACLVRAIEVGGAALGAVVGTALGNGEVGAHVGKLVANYVGPTIARTVAKGVTLLVPMLAKYARRAKDHVTTWVRSFSLVKRIASLA